MPNINLKISIDGKEANATIKLTDSNIKELYKSFKYGKQEVNGLTTSISQGFNNAREILGGVREAYQAITSLFQKPIQARIELEQAQVSFKVLFGSAEKADERIKELYNFTAKTPFQLNEVITASRQLEVLTRGALSSGDGLRMVGDVASGVGVPIGELSGWFGRLYDGIQSGRPVGEALMRLQELGVMSGDVRGKIERLSKSGADSAIVWDVVTEAMGRFGGMMDEQSATLGGKLSNLEDNFTQLQTSIGGTLAVGLSPFLEHINSVTASLNKNHPELIGFIGAVSTMGIAVGILNTTGIMPLIFNTGTLRTAIGTARVQLHLANVAGYATAGGFRAASIAAKGLWTSLGPVGWAIIGITALVEVVNLLGDGIETVTENIDTLSAKSLESLRSEKAELSGMLYLTEETLKSKKNELNARAGINAVDAKSEKLRTSILDLEKQIAPIKNEQLKLTEEIEKKEKQIEASVKSQYDSLKNRMEIDSAETAKEKNLIQLKQSYDKDVVNLQEALTLKIVTAEQYEKDLTELTKNYNNKRTEELKKLPKAIVGLYAEIDNKIKELNDKKATAKTIAEIVEIENKIDELTREKKVIEFEVDWQKRSGGALDFSNLKAEGDGGIEVPKTMKPLDVASDYEELNAMKFAIIEDGYQRESDLLDAKYQADLVKYKDVIGAKEILDADYTKKKEELDKAATEAQVQGTIDALNFIATAVAEHTVAGKAIAVANATWNTYKAANSALAEIPPPFNFVMAGLVTAAGLANVAKIVGITAEPPKKFEHGGRFKKGESGFIEGYHNEIIAPEKTFIEVFQKELRPQIYANSSVGSAAVVDTRGIQATIQAELAKFTLAMENKHWAIKGEDIATSNRRYSERRERNSF